MILTLRLDKAVKPRNYSKLVPVKKQDRTGKTVTRWVSQDEQGQEKLFGDDEGSGGEDYLFAIEEAQREHQIKPLLEIMRGVDAGLADKMEAKYADYGFDQDTKELDLKIDYDTLYYMMKIQSEPGNAKAYQKEYDEKTTQLTQQLNNRKRAMIRIKRGSSVTVDGERGTVTGFTAKGYPEVKIGEETRPVLYSEIQPAEDEE
jgi:hypothetical protein